MKKILYILLGCISLGFGVLGAILPLLPAFPFLLLTAFCFARSSEKLDTWFKSTNLYKNNLESFVKGEGMSKQTKVKIMSLISGLMLFGFICMGAVPIGRIVLFFVWAFHMWYFIYRIKTIN